MPTQIRDAHLADFEAIRALNQSEVQHTSALDVVRLTELHGLSCYHRVAVVDGTVAAFVLALCDGAAYRNENFDWFSRRFARFLYIDRIVVSATRRGLKLGTLLYEDVFRYARTQAIPVIACEYNIVPPNEPSRAFHDRLGFEEQGTQWVADGSKRVSLQAARVPEAAVT
jgi:predicted GNAT superfamily acetyltransferase